MFTAAPLYDPSLPWSGPLSLTGAMPPTPRVAVVGSRAAHRRALARIPALVTQIGAGGACVISGGAIGIDRAVHEAALAAAIPQLAVLPCPPDRPYPSQHAALFEAIACAPASGLLFTQACGAAPSRGLFASRNRLVVALSQAVIVVEARTRSGSWSTGRAALARSIPVAVVPGSPGCADLLQRGAHPLPPPAPGAPWSALTRFLASITGASVAFEDTPWPPRLRWLVAPLAAAGARGCSIDALDDPARALVDLLAAERLGLVVELAPGRYRSIA
ncbi:MAG: DNA-processing protein DprA [Nannocystaceae bacterium]